MRNVICRGDEELFSFPPGTEGVRVRKAQADCAGSTPITLNTIPVLLISGRTGAVCTVLVSGCCASELQH